MGVGIGELLCLGFHGLDLQCPLRILSDFSPQLIVQRGSCNVRVLTSSMTELLIKFLVDWPDGVGVGHW